MAEPTAFIIGSATAAALLIIGHWVPLPGRNGKLPQTITNLLARYIYGSLSLWAGAVVWLLLTDRGLWLAVILLAIDAIGGIAVGFVYFWDEAVTAFNQRKAIERADEELTK